MKNSETILRQSIEDIVFENRNKAYGAYQLRKDTDKFLKIALLIGCMFVTVISAFSLTNKKTSSEIGEVEYTDTTTVIFDDIELPEVPPVQEPVAAPPAVTAQQMFVEMVQVPDDVPTTDPTHIDDLDPNIAIGTSTVLSPNTNTPIDPEPQITTGGTGISDKTAIYDFVGSMPEYIGGPNAMLKFLSHEIHYPAMAREIGVEGKVFVEFVVNADGSISDVKVLRGIGYGCDEEAIRAVLAMPKWLPGKQNNIAVRVHQRIPITFQLVKN